MKLLKSTLMASALILGTASVSFAQDKSYGSGTQAKDMAVDKATDMAKDKVESMAGEKAGKMVDPAMKAGKHMMEGDSMKDAAMKAGKSEMKDTVKSYGSGTTGASMNGKDAMTAGKVMMKGGSKEDAMMAVGKEKAKDAMMEKAEHMMKDKVMHQGTIKTSAPSYGSGSTGDAMMKKGEDAMMKKGDHMMKDGMQKSYGSGTPAAAPAVPALNCPFGTTAQANGTCMVTGNYQPRS